MHDAASEAFFSRYSTLGTKIETEGARSAKASFESMFIFLISGLI